MTPEELRARRTRLRLTVREVCEPLNMDPSNYSKMENGRRVISNDMAAYLDHKFSSLEADAPRYTCPEEVTDRHELYQYRKYLGWSQTRLGAKLGYATSTVAAWETGRLKIPNKVLETLNYEVQNAQPETD